ncbi:unnamed protein product [Chrysoparadoxa australica]
MSLRDVIGDGNTEELLDEAGVLMSHVQRLVVKEMRPWAEFIGPVSLPSADELKRRLSLNFGFFRTNYMVIVVACSFFYIVTSPGLLVTLMLCMLMFLAVFMSRRRPLKLGDLELHTREKLGAATVASVLLLSLTGYIFTLQWSLLIGGMLSMGHASFRPPVARAVAHQSRADAEHSAGSGGMAAMEDLEGGGDPRNMPANANIRLVSCVYLSLPSWWLLA